MVKQKQFYTAPEAEAFVMGFEGIVCASPTGETMNGTTMLGIWGIDD